MVGVPISNERLQTVAHRLLVALSADDRLEGSDETSIEAGLSLEALLFVAAGIIEADERLASTKDLREAAERAGDTVRSYTRKMRELYHAEGVHGLVTIGARLHEAPAAN